MSAPGAVIFDLDGTLVDRDAALRAWARARVRSPDARDALEGILAELPESRSELLRRARGSLRADVSLALLDEELPRFVRPEPEIAAALETLAARVPIALLTNGAARAQRAKLLAAGLARCFGSRRVLVSGELGVRKPSEGAFRAALDAVGVAADRALFVGDRDELDLSPARALGCATVLVSREAGLVSREAGLVSREAAGPWHAPIVRLCARAMES